MSNVQNEPINNQLGKLLIKGVIGIILLIVMLLSYFFYDTKKDDLYYDMRNPGFEIRECSAEVIQRPEGYINSDYDNLTEEESKVVLVKYVLSNSTNASITLYSEPFHYVSDMSGSVYPLKSETKGVVFDNYSNQVMIPAGENTIYSEYVQVTKDATVLTCKNYSNSTGTIDVEVKIME